MRMVSVHHCHASTSTRTPTTWSIANSNNADWVNTCVLAMSGSTGNGAHFTRCTANLPALAAGLHGMKLLSCSCGCVSFFCTQEGGDKIQGKNQERETRA